jgi:hypothetical protein
MYAGERQIGDDGDSLTEMSEACLTQDDTMRQKCKLQFCEGLDKRTDLSKQFWDLRYQVQKIQLPFHDQEQKVISFRLDPSICSGGKYKLEVRV